MKILHLIWWTIAALFSKKPIVRWVEKDYLDRHGAGKFRYFWPRRACWYQLYKDLQGYERDSYDFHEWIHWHRYRQGDDDKPAAYTNELWAYAGQVLLENRIGHDTFDGRASQLAMSYGYGHSLEKVRYDLEATMKQFDFDKMHRLFKKQRA